MSETDEGSTGFELLDEDPPVELTGTNAPPGPKVQSSGRSSGASKSASETPSAARQQQLPQQPQTTEAADTAALTRTTGGQTLGSFGRTALSTAGTPVQPGEDNAHEDQSSMYPQSLNADMVWSGLQWGASLLSRVTEKAKESVDKVITTLDPQMKPIIFSGGDLNIIVASDKNDKIMPIQDAFWDVFGRATVEGVKAQPSSMAAQPVGFTAGLKAAEDRIQCLRAAGDVHPDLPVVAVEGFVAELSKDYWCELACVLLQDRALGINVSLYTQATPLPEEWVTRMQEDTPPDYPLSWCGFAKTIGEVASDALHCARNKWHERHTGLPRSALIYQAARSVAFIYQQRLQAIQQQQQQQQETTPVQQSATASLGGLVPPTPTLSTAGGRSDKVASPALAATTTAAGGGAASSVL